MITQQKKLVLSQYTGLYDILVPADHFLRRLHDDIDFSFIYRELVDKYSESMGRTAYDLSLIHISLPHISFVRSTRAKRCPFSIITRVGNGALAMRSVVPDGKLMVSPSTLT